MDFKLSLSVFVSFFLSKHVFISVSYKYFVRKFFENHNLIRVTGNAEPINPLYTGNP